MTRYSRKKGQNPPNRRIGKRCLKTKKYKKDLDLIKQQLINTITDTNDKKETIVENINEEDTDYDIPANGQYSCTHCE